jgi:hypothetical protein
MPKDYLRIKQARPDLTDYLIHWTQGGSGGGGYKGPFEVLKSILECGFLRPTFAPKSRATVGGRENTIKGLQPAVCFTEQPLAAFIKSWRTLGRYNPYGIAVRKDRLYQYGGRPVVYNDETFLNRLSDEDKYLWVRYDPIPEASLGGYPIDWTHEREWRARSAKYQYLHIGTSPAEGVPLLLPPEFESQKTRLVLPWILVRKEEEIRDLKAWMAALPPYGGSNGVLKQYFDVLLNVPIIALEEVEKRLNDGDERWARLDTLPLEEIDKTTAASLERLGWRDL